MSGKHPLTIGRATLLAAILSVFATVAVYPLDAAAGSAYDTPMGAVICNIAGMIIYGNLGRGLATLGVIIVGVGAMLGKVSWGLALTVAIGVSAIFGAPTIVFYLAPLAGSC